MEQFYLHYNQMDIVPRYSDLSNTKDNHSSRIVAIRRPEVARWSGAESACPWGQPRSGGGYLITLRDGVHLPLRETAAELAAVSFRRLHVQFIELFRGLSET